jgi:hypothetical protein
METKEKSAKKDSVMLVLSAAVAVLVILGTVMEGLSSDYWKVTSLDYILRLVFFFVSGACMAAGPIYYFIASLLKKETEKRIHGLILFEILAAFFNTVTDGLSLLREYETPSRMLEDVLLAFGFLVIQVVLLIGLSFKGKPHKRLIAWILLAAAYAIVFIIEFAVLVGPGKRVMAFAFILCRLLPLLVYGFLIALDSGRRDENPGKPVSDKKEESSQA